MKWYSWIEPPVDAHEKSINQQTKRATYDKSKTTNEKLSMKRIEICLIQFCVIHVDPPFKINFQIMSEHHCTKQNWIRLVELFYVEVSDPSEVPRIDGT